jgi:hypothetical protein
MSDTRPPEDTPEWLETYLDAGRDVPGLPQDVEARMLSRLTAGVAGAGAAPVEDAAATSAASLGASKLVVVGALAVGLALGTGMGAALHARLAEPEVRVVERVVEVRVPSRPQAPVPVPTATEDAGVLVIVDAAVERPRADAGPRRAEGAGVDVEVEDAGQVRTRDEALADENALITRAQSALARGRASETLVAVHEHERDFPRGRFVEEREVLAIQALARLGRTDQASARAERFYRRFPSSMLTRVVRNAVGTP